MRHNGDYIPTLNSIRSKIQMFNSQLDTYKEVKSESLLTTGIALHERALVEQCQQKTSVMQFVASEDAFSLYWETMTCDKHIRYLHEYVDSEYSMKSEAVRNQIKAFLVSEIVHKKNGFKRVQWNGYFIEKLPELQIVFDKDKKEHTSKQTSQLSENNSDTGAEKPNNDGDKIIIQFKKTSNTNVQEKKQHANKDVSFKVMRAKLQREKDSFFSV